MSQTKLSFFDRVHLANHDLPSRFVVAPMTRLSATAQGVPTDEMGHYYEAFAKGGFAAIITEGVYTDTVASICSHHQPGIVTEEQVQAWQSITQRIKRFSTVFICQLMHAGGLSQVLTHTLAPSAIKPLGQKLTSVDGMGDFPVPTAMSQTDINAVIAGYVIAAQNAVRAGFDGIELHAANGYLPDQFLTAYSNNRTDQYGGSVTNRFRFIAEVLVAIRTAVPADFIVGLRLSEGKVNNLAYRWEEGAEMAEAVFAEVKIAAPDYLHMAAEGGGWQRECLYADGRSSTSIARQLLDCPVIANGGLHDLTLADSILQDGHGDLLAIGRYAIANPDFPAKVKRGKLLVPFQSGMIKPTVTLANTRQFLAQHCFDQERFKFVKLSAEYQPV
jgi:2,4-dienoyl-CoA reductase-like NADH-dependent reductase (Old Yellow Enzyme family)